MGDRLKGKVAVITGAGRGIGRGHALCFASEGAKVVANELGGAPDGTGGSKGPADEVVEEIKSAGGEAVANYDSVATPEGGENIIKTALDTFGRLDILVNNAGVLRDRMIFNMTEEEWDTVMKVHLYGTFHCSKPACVVFRQQRSGRIVNTSSTSGLGNRGQGNYAAAKEGITGFTRTLGRDMGRYGVTCNAIRPAAATRMTVSPEMEAARKRREEQGLPPAATDITSLVPEAIAPLVVFLCTDEAANINGRIFYVRAGQISLMTDPEIWRSMHKDGRWTVDELCELLPRSLAVGLVNPSPPAPPKE